MKKIFVVVLTERVGGNLVKKSAKAFADKNSASAYFKAEKLQFVEDYRLNEETDNINYLDRHDLLVVEDINEATMYELFIKECDME